MKKWAKIVTWSLMVLFLLIIVIFISMKFIVQGGETKVIKKLDSLGVQIHFDSLETELGLARYARAGNGNGAKLILIHGSPGDWSAWVNVFANPEIIRDFDVIAIDRAGYGNTKVPPQEQLMKQAAIPIQIANQIWGDSSFIVVGHSYGGAVAEKLLIEYPKQIKGGVLVAPTIGPDYQAPKWYNKIAKWAIVNPFLPSMFQSSNIEMLALQEELKRNESRLGDIKSPIIFIHGKKDVLVPYATVNYFQEHVKENVKYVILDSMNHFVPWSNPELINNAILELNK